MVEELNVIPVQSTDSTNQQEGVVLSRVESEGTGLETELVSEGTGVWFQIFILIPN